MIRMLAVVLCLLACSTGYAGKLREIKKYTYDEYTVSFPKEWKELSQKEVAQYIDIKSTMLRGWALQRHSDGPATALAGIYAIPPSEVPLTDAWEAIIDALQNAACEAKEKPMHMNFRLLYRGETLLNGRDARYCALTAQEGGKQVCMLLYFVIVKNRAYCLGFLSEMKDFFLLNHNFEAVAKSFMCTEIEDDEIDNDDEEEEGDDDDRDDTLKIDEDDEKEDFGKKNQSQTKMQKKIKPEHCSVQ